MSSSVTSNHGLTLATASSFPGLTTRACSSFLSSPIVMIGLGGLKTLLGPKMSNRVRSIFFKGVTSLNVLSFNSFDLLLSFLESFLADFVCSAVGALFLLEVLHNPMIRMLLNEDPSRSELQGGRVLSIFLAQSSKVQARSLRAGHTQLADFPSTP